MERFQILKNRETTEREVETLIADAQAIDEYPMDRAEAIEYVKRQLDYAIEDAAAAFDREPANSRRQLRAGAHYLAVNAQADYAHDLASDLLMAERERGS